MYYIHSQSGNVNSSKTKMYAHPAVVSSNCMFMIMIGYDYALYLKEVLR